jgi:hypothetical protein
MTRIAHVDFFNPARDTDSSPEVVQIYRNQFPRLYQAVDRGDIKT